MLPARIRPVRLPRTVPLLAAASLLLAACAVFEPAAAVVDGSKIPDDDFQRLVDFLAADPSFGDPAGAEEGFAEQRRELARQVLTFLLEQEVIGVRAAERSIVVSPDDVDALLQQQIERVGGEEAFGRQLEDSGASVADVSELIRQQILRDRVARDVVQQEVTEEDLRAAFEERLPDLTTVHVAHILVSDQGEAEDLAARATPENFERLARARSEDTGSAPAGGDLGPRPASDFIEPFAEAALTIPVGEIGGPVQTEFGFHIIRVLDRETPSFEDVQQQLLDEASGEVFQRWLREQVLAAEIRVNPRYGIFDPEVGQVVSRTATTPGVEPVQLEP